MPDALAKVLGQPIAGPRRQVEKAIRTAILSGELQVGERLPAEAELARQFEVSRTTIREALQSLWAEGLIRKIPRGRRRQLRGERGSPGRWNARCSSPCTACSSWGPCGRTRSTWCGNCSSCQAVRLAALNRGDADLTQLRANIAARRAVAGDDPRVAELDSDFHRLAAEASGNRVLAALIAALHAESAPDAQAQGSEQGDEITLRHHQEIADAIAARDADEAETAVIAHLSFIRSQPS